MELYFDEDGVAHEYDDTWDITIHCESEEEHNKIVEIIQKALENLSCEG